MIRSIPLRTRMQQGTCTVPSEITAGGIFLFASKPAFGMVTGTTTLTCQEDSNLISRAPAHKGIHRFSCAVFAALFTALWFTGGSPALPAQAPAPANPEMERSTTLARQTALRDQFIKRVHSDGFTCSTPAPAIVVDDVPSFGNYGAHNTLRTSDWTLLQPNERGLFFRLAGAGADEAAAHAAFEEGVHHWVFVHEMGHWWQDCSHAFKVSGPYENEFNANRIALAYWREVDPALAERMIALFQGMLGNAPSPVPSGQSMEEYFNKNYETLGPSPAYPWFQARMVVTASQETPVPTFARVLAGNKK